MKYKVFYMVMMIALFMVSANASANKRGDYKRNDRKEYREMRMHNDGRFDIRRDEVHWKTKKINAHHAHPRLDARGYVPGWEGRVRCVNGRWGYLRGHDWYWYDTYFAPDYYYSHPVHVFRPYLSPAGRVAAGVAGGVAGGIVLGSIIASLCR